MHHSPLYPCPLPPLQTPEAAPFLQAPWQRLHQARSTARSVLVEQRSDLAMWGALASIEALTGNAKVGVTPSVSSLICKGELRAFGIPHSQNTS